MRIVNRDIRNNARLLTMLLSAIVLFVCCNDSRHNDAADNANDMAYRYHYISLDSIEHYSNLAISLSKDYKDGSTEAQNHLAFVDIMKMNYKAAEQKLTKVISATDNQIEQLVANVQMMRICQRQSRNKQFYDYYWRAKTNIGRIEEEQEMLTPRQRLRFVYAKTELQIILSAYYYYVGLIDNSVEALTAIDENGEIQRDTTQLLNYLYNAGSGSFLKGQSPEEVAIKEFDYLERCYFLSRRGGYIYWEANALQAMSEHLQNIAMVDTILVSQANALKSVNENNAATENLDVEFATRALNLFYKYGDKYQTAGALRTLSDCYFNRGEHAMAIDCLKEALDNDDCVKQTPALLASIHEKLTLNYSAIDDKHHSDTYRNLYLDTQENTRQDRELEARAEQLGRSSLQLNLIIVVVCVVIVIVALLLLFFSRMGRRREKENDMEVLLAPLKRWEQDEKVKNEKLEDEYEEIMEQQATASFMLEKNIQQNIEQRAKMALVNSITPFIDRMLGEINNLSTRHESEDVVKSRYDYILELTDKINEYNSVLTDWIQLRKGDLSLKIESFSLQSLFDIVKKGRTSFNMQGVDLIVKDTDAVVKADRTLTLFMINTIADNARKVTSEGGVVKIEANRTDSFVEVSISDTGCGMNEEELANVFNHQPSAKVQHGFGLMNCKGIIEKYKKVSSLFSVCAISAESEKGKGTTFRFRLPVGISRMIVAFMMCLGSLTAFSQTAQEKAVMFADSVFFCNLQQRFEQSLVYADSARTYYNIVYKQIRPNGTDVMELYGESADDAAELKWFADSLQIDYSSIIDMRNEVAVAALALHNWPLYNYNNKIYVRLFREQSADHNLLEYVSMMKHDSDVKNVAIILLFLLLASILPAYYMLYYRHKIYYKFLVDKLGTINNVLFDDIADEEKLERINSLWKESERYLGDNDRSRALADVVSLIVESLKKNVEVKQNSEDEIELAQDVLKKLNYENARLHVNNNVLDNCFSTLKHETMYYPSRIRQLIEDSEDNIAALGELTLYYKELYNILSMQAQKQVEAPLRLDEQLSHFLLVLLRKVAGKKEVDMKTEQVDKIYNRYTVSVPELKLSEEEVRDLFTPLTCNLSCMVIRQIVREVGEATNHRGCGVWAQQREDKGTDIVMVISRKMKFAKQ